MKMSAKSGYFGDKYQQAIEVEEGERVKISIVSYGKQVNKMIEEEILGFFLPGVVVVEYRMGSHIERSRKLAEAKERR